MILHLFVPTAVQWSKHFSSLERICIKLLISPGRWLFLWYTCAFLCVCHKGVFLTSPGYRQWNCRYNLYKLCSACIMINIRGEKHLEYILMVIRILQMMNCKALIKKQNVRAPDFHFPYAPPISCWQWTVTFKPFSTSKALVKGIDVNLLHSTLELLFV